MLRTFVAVVAVLFAAVTAKAVEFKDALAALRDKDFARVVKVLDEYLPNHADDHRAYALRGRAHVELRAFDKALPDLDKAIAVQPLKSGNDYENRGRAYRGLGQIDKAIEDLTKAIEANPKQAERYYHRGEAYLAQGDNEKAFADLHAAIGIDPQYVAAYLLRGRAQVSRGVKTRVVTYQQGGQVFSAVQYEGISDRVKVEEGIADFTKAIELDADHIAAYDMRRQAYDILGDAKKSIADLKQVCARRPDDVERLNELAWQLATHPNDEIRNGKEALELAEKACELTKHEELRFLDTLAAALAESKRFKRAVTIQKQAIELMESKASADFKTQYAKEFVDRLELYKQNKPYRCEVGK